MASRNPFSQETLQDSYNKYTLSSPTPTSQWYSKMSQLFMLSFVIFAILGSIPTATSYNLASDGTSELEKFDDVMKSLMEIAKAPGAQLAVSKEGQLKYFKAFGVANTDTAEPVTTSHVMRYYSVSKIFTGIAILKLVQEGKLSLHDKPFIMLEHLEALEGAKVDPRIYNITIQNLLQHAGGWNATASGLAVGSLPSSLFPQKSPTHEDYVRYMKGVPLHFDPGTGMEYSNAGYVILGRVIEKVTGKPYRKHISTTFFEPLRMDSVGSANTRLQDLAPNEVRYYGVDGIDTEVLSVFEGAGMVNKSYGARDLSMIDSGAGWMGNAKDVVKFVDHVDGLRRPGILDEETLAVLFNAEMPANRGSFQGNPLFDHPKGLSVFVSLDEDGDEIASFQHPGGAPGGHAFFMRLVDVNVTFCFMFNTAPSSFIQSFDGIAVTQLGNVARNVSNWPSFDLFAHQSPSSTIHEEL